MFGISVADAVAIVGVFAVVLTAYLGTQKGASAKATEIAQSPAVNQTGTALLIDGRVLDRLTIACDRIATSIEDMIAAHDRREAREAAHEMKDTLGAILDELKRGKR